MASVAEELPEYSSPTKRRRLADDEEALGPRAEDKLDRMAPSSRPGRPVDELEGSLSDNNGFAELSDGIKSASTSSEFTNSSNTPTRTDSMSDDTGFPVDTADEKDEVSSTVSNLSDITGMSILSDDGDGTMEWRNASSWVQKQMEMGTDPRDVLKLISQDPTQIPDHLDDITLWRIVINVMSEPPKRQKLSEINTILDVVELIKKSKNVIVLTGAGVSVSCGIPDFRSRDGIYSRLAQDFPDLPDPQAMFDINYFSQDPRPFFKFAREIYPGQFKPSPCHRFIKMLEEQKKLLRNYSQNIDTLERVAGINNLIECHGSFATASCTKCKYQVKSDDVKADIFAQTIPMCPKCQEQSLPSIGDSTENYKDIVSQGVMKPDIVFFGEGLPDAFHDAMASDKDICDLLIVIGSSLKVRPVALIPSSIPPTVPQILINRESLPHLEFDVELLGDGDVIVNQLCHMLEGTFKEVCWHDTVLQEAPKLLPPQFPLNESWDQSQDTLTNQDFSQDSSQVEQDNFVESSSSKRELLDFDQDGQDGSSTVDRPWKKIKSDSDLKELFADEPISCTKFYSNIVDYYEKKKDFTDEDTSKNNSSDSDIDSMSENTDGSQNRKVPSSEGETKDGQKENKLLDDRPWNKEDKQNEVSNAFTEDNTISDNECLDVRTLSFHSEYTEHTVKNFTFIEDSHETQLNSITFDGNIIRTDIQSSSKASRKSMTLSSGESPTTSYESSSRATEEIYISEECHVVPRIDCLREDSALEGKLDTSKLSDKADLKPRHASIDSIMDSALGDSCSSSDCQKRKNDEDNTDENKKYHKLDSHSWQPIDRDSLASRLPENAYYQMKPGKYIFPGAEVFTNFPWNEGVLQIGGLRSALTVSQLREH